MGPSFSPSSSIVFKNSFSSASQSISIFSCVMTCGTLTEKMKPSGVLAPQLATVRAEGHA